MKTMKYAGAMLCAVALMAGCSQEELVDGQMQQPKEFTLTASVGSDTRTSVSETYQVLWSAGDAIYAYGADGQAFSKLKLESAAGQASGTFGGSLIGEQTDLTYAVYPHVEQTGGFTYGNNLAPTEYTFPTTYTYPNSNAPMFGELTDGGTKVVFDQHLSAMMRITVGVPTGVTGEKKLTLKADNLAGAAAFSYAEGEAKLAMPASGSNEVTVTFTDATPGADCVLDIPIPAGVYANGIEASLKLGDAEAIVYKTATGLTMTAGKLMVMPAIRNIKIEGENISFAKDVFTIAEAQEALNNGFGNISLKNIAIDASNSALELPAALTDIVIDLGEVSGTSATQPLVIKPASGASNQHVTIIGGSTTDKYVEVEAEHVVLTGNVKQVKAKTGSDTFVVEEGATVENLMIAAGNVEVKGTVKALSTTSSTIVNVASSGAADIQSVTEPEKFKFTATWDGTSVVAAAPTNGDIYTASQLAYYTQASASLTGNITLHTDIDLTTAEKATDGSNWKAMGGTAAHQYVNSYTGTFDGKGHTIKGMIIADIAQEHHGFIRDLGANGIVKDIQFVDYKISSTVVELGGVVGNVRAGASVIGCTISGNSFITTTNGGGNSVVGGIVGDNYGTVTGCFIRGNVHVISNGGQVGGIVGRNGNEVSGCEVICEENSEILINGKNQIGGIVGNNSINSKLSNCKTTNTTNNGKIKISMTTNTAGGVIGSAANSTVTNCRAVGCIIYGDEETTKTVGGIVGNNDGTTLSGCFAENCQLSAAEWVGGIAGKNSSDKNSGIIVASYAKGLTMSITKNNGTLGGIVGINAGSSAFGSIIASYAINTATTLTGGANIVGANESEKGQKGTISDCYYYVSDDAVKQVYTTDDTDKTVSVAEKTSTWSEATSSMKTTMGSTYTWEWGGSSDTPSLTNTSQN